MGITYISRVHILCTNSHFVYSFYIVVDKRVSSCGNEPKLQRNEQRIIRGNFSEGAISHLTGKELNYDLRPMPSSRHKCPRRWHGIERSS